jgi:uncharacterized protein YggT (Ycf19 family)
MQSVVAEPVTVSRKPTIERIARVFDYTFGLLYSLLAIRLVLELISARRTSGFYEFIRAVTDFFYAPFNAIVRTDTVDGAHVVWSLLVAILAYMLLHAAIRGLLRLASRG